MGPVSTMLGYKKITTRKAGLWERRDLLRRVSEVLEFSEQVVHSVVHDEWPETTDVQSTGLAGAFQEKVIAETAMLLFCVASVPDVERALRGRIQNITTLLTPLARSERILAELCAHPEQASDIAVAHAIVSRLGCPNTHVDALLRECVALHRDFGPERLPLCRLSKEWLARVWGSSTATHPEPGLLVRSILGRPLDLLGATRFDVYSFTHAIIYATDFGGRRPRFPRSKSAIAVDADAALGLSLDIDDLDVTSELLMTWPMLALAWSPTATFAFSIVSAAYDQFGFLPGPTFESTGYEVSTLEARVPYVFATSYHTTYVMGMLCAAALREGSCPPMDIVCSTSTGSSGTLLSLYKESAVRPRWRSALDKLTPSQQDAVAPLILTILLRQAKDRADFCELRAILEVAVAYGLVEGPAVRQATALLKRSALFSRIIASQECAPLS